jgi:hypothetical protein
MKGEKMKNYSLIATKYNGKKMLAPMYFTGNKKTINKLKKQKYNVKIDTFKRFE